MNHGREHRPWNGPTSHVSNRPGPAPDITWPPSHSNQPSLGSQRMANPTHQSPGYGHHSHPPHPQTEEPPHTLPQSATPPPQAQFPEGSDLHATLAATLTFLQQNCNMTKQVSTVNPGIRVPHVTAQVIKEDPSMHLIDPQRQSTCHMPDQVVTPVPPLNLHPEFIRVTTPNAHTGTPLHYDGIQHVSDPQVHHPNWQPTMPRLWGQRPWGLI